jgi:hypothetical protein
MSESKNNTYNDNNLFSYNSNIKTNYPNYSQNNLLNGEHNDTNMESSHLIEDTKKSRRKYSPDCLRKKLKRLVLKYAFIFIKGKIKFKYDDLKKIGSGQIKNISIEFEKEFLYKTLGEIFSDPISNKHTTIQNKKNFNKDKIDRLRKKDDELKNIFDVKFIQCLRHFMGIQSLDILDGMKIFDEIKNSEKKIDKMEENNLKFISIDYEERILKSKPRNNE